ncbi:MAG TPA: DUF167 domain-containing protein [Gemmatimonadales bacterium]|nr:DUF167 domain-containing protein [Gemmatimonadales bacterium]
MEKSLTPIQQTTNGVLLRIRVAPRASHTEITGIEGGMIRLRLAAVPADGAANETLVRFLAERIEVPRSAVRLASGQKSRSKIVAINGVKLEFVRDRLGL